MPKYYPKSQIKTNLYTNGDIYQIPSTKEPYIGDYYKISNGKIYSGKNPSDPTSIELELISKISQQSKFRPDFYYPTTPLSADVPFDPSEYTNKIDPISEVDILSNSTFKYNKLKPLESSQKLLPQFYLNQPNLKDYEIGEYQRFFCKKNNENIYLEISPNYYTKLKTQDSSVLHSLYTPAKIMWNIVGSIPKTYQVNKNLVKLIERKQKWSGFSKYFKGNYIQFHINTPKNINQKIPSSFSAENLFTKGGEYVTEQGKNYIGPYHIHPGKGLMVGAKHVSSPHDYLYKVGQLTGSISSTTSTTLSPSSGGGGGY